MGDPSPTSDQIRETDTGPDRRSTNGTSPWQKVVGIIGLIVVLWVGTETYTVVYGGSADPGGHDPGQDAPIEDREQESDPGDDGGHDPSRFDHG